MLFTFVFPIAGTMETFNNCQEGDGEKFNKNNKSGLLTNRKKINAEPQI